MTIGWQVDRSFSTVQVENFSNADPKNGQSAGIAITNKMATDEDKMVSVEEFFDIVEDAVRNTREQDIRNNLISYLQGLIESIDNHTIGGTQEEQMVLNTEDTFVKLIVKWFWRIAKLDEHDELFKYLVNPMNSEYRYCRDDLLHGTEARLISVIGKMLDPNVNIDLEPGGREAKVKEGCNEWYNIIKLLLIIKEIRNKNAHGLGAVFELKDSFSINRFRLFCYMTTVLCLRKSLTQQGYINEPYVQKPVILQVKVYDNEKPVENAEKRVTLIGGKYKEEPLNNFGTESGRAEYEILRYRTYTIKADVEGNPKSKFTTTWATLSPVCTIKGAKGATIDFKNNSSEENSKGVSSSFHQVMERCNNVFECLATMGANIEDIRDSNVTIVKQLADIHKTQSDNTQAIVNAIKGQNINREIPADDPLVKAVNIWIMKQEKQKAKESKKWYVVISLLAVIIALLIAPSMKTCINEKQKFSAMELLGQGDSLLKEGKPEKAGLLYKEAIKKYEEILAQDSTNVDANIGLATLLMRGKGDFDLDLAERCARRTIADTTQNRGEGLYIYLLALNGKHNEASKYLRRKTYSLTDDYAVLADAILNIYGHNGKRTKESVLKAYSIIKQLNIQEAIIEDAVILRNGIETEEKEGYWIQPVPLIAANYFNHIAKDSLNPTALALMSDFLDEIGDIQNSIDYDYVALAAGCKLVAPILRIRLLSCIDLENAEDFVKKTYEKITKLTGQQNSVNVAISDFIQEHYKWIKRKGSISIQQLIEDLNILIDLLEKEEDVYTTILGELYHKRISLYLESGNMSKATQLTMNLDNCQDSVAVHNYLLGVCYAKGYGDIRQDTVMSDSLIRLSADKGYIEAMYTCLRRDGWRITETKTNNSNTGDTKEAVLRGFPRNKKSINKKDNNAPKSSIQKDKKQSDSDKEPMEIKLGVAGSITEYTYLPSKYAFVPDSIWQKSPKFALALLNYWCPHYDKIKSISPYIKYCPKEFQILTNVVDGTIEQISDHKFNLKEYVSPETFVNLLNQIEEGIAIALNNNRSQIARHLITYEVIMMKAASSFINRDQISFYENFVLPEYKENGKIQLFPDFDFPVYAY